MAEYKVEEMNETVAFRLHQIEAPDAINSAMIATGRTIRSGRQPGRVWIRVTDDRGTMHEYH
jgi:hypothetical protein